jgi:lauroyl/myristoyl acyltransferase
VAAASALVRAAEHVLPTLPNASLRAVAEVVGTAAYLVAGHRRAAVRANLDVVAPGRPLSVRAVFVNQALQYLEVFRIPRIDRRRLEAAIRVDGWEHFECAHAKGKGVIFASAHLGPVAFVGQIVIVRGYELTLPIERVDSEVMRAVNRARSAQGMTLVPIDSPLALHRVLKQGRVLGVLADRAVSGVGVRVPFCGREALLPSAHVALALRTGAACVPAFTWRENGALHACIEPPLELANTGDHAADIREGVRRFAARLETYVRRYPEQWTVFEHIWS